MVGARDDSGRSTDGRGDSPTCDAPDCSDRAAVRLHVPWDEDRRVCPAHARVLARPDGVVAEPIEGVEDEWP